MQVDFSHLWQHLREYVLQNFFIDGLLEGFGESHCRNSKPVNQHVKTLYTKMWNHQNMINEGACDVQWESDTYI